MLHPTPRNAATGPRHIEDFAGSGDGRHYNQPRQMLQPAARDASTSFFCYNRILVFLLRGIFCWNRRNFLLESANFLLQQITRLFVAEDCLLEPVLIFAGTGFVFCFNHVLEFLLRDFVLLEHGGASRRRRRDGGSHQRGRSCNPTCFVPVGCCVELLQIGIQQGGGSELEPASGRSCIRKSCNGRWDGDRRRVAASSGASSLRPRGRR